MKPRLTLIGLLIVISSATSFAAIECEFEVQQRTRKGVQTTISSWQHQPGNSMLTADLGGPLTLWNQAPINTPETINRWMNELDESEGYFFSIQSSQVDPSNFKFAIIIGDIVNGEMINIVQQTWSFDQNHKKQSVRNRAGRLSCRK